MREVVRVVGFGVVVVVILVGGECGSIVAGHGVAARGSGARESGFSSSHDIDRGVSLRGRFALNGASKPPAIPAPWYSVSALPLRCGMSVIPTDCVLTLEPLSSSVFTAFH